MKALVLELDKSLQIKELPAPTAKEGEVVVAIKASALNHREIWIQKGLYPGMTLPCILGADGAGVVTEIGKGVDMKWKGKEVILYPGYEWGDNDSAPTKKFRVLGMPDPGTISEYIAVPVTNLVVKPSYLSWGEAAAIPVASLTAWRALVKHGEIHRNSRVLITGIGGGVAQAGLSIAKAFGATVFVTSSSPDKIKQAQDLGATAGVNYRDDDWHLQLKEISDGIDIVLDSSPHPVLDNYLKFMNYGGRIIAYGSTGSPKTTISISKFFLRHIQFIGTAMGTPQEFRDVILFLDKHKIRPLIHSEYTLDQAIQSMEALKAGHQVGKIIINH